MSEACRTGSAVRSACPLCSLACPLELEPGCDGTLTASSPAGSPVHCRRGPWGLTALTTGPRLHTPSVRTRGQAEPASWPDAIAAAARGLETTIRRHGPEAVAVLASASLPLEASWLTRWLALEGLGTTQVGSVAAALRGTRGDLDALLGRTASTCSVGDLARADLILVVGADPERSHPGLCLPLEAARRGGAEIIVLHSGYTQLASRADLWLDPRRGSLSTLLAASLASVRAQAVLPDGLPGELVAALQGADARVDPGELARVSGCDHTDLVELASRLLRARRVVAVYDLGDASERSRDDLPLLAGLLASVGGFSRPGSGLLLLGAEVNHYGVCLGDLHEDIGLLVREGGLRGLLVIGEDPTMQPWLEPGLRSLEHLVLIDAYPSGTADRADVVLPSPSLPESGGTFVASDGAVRIVEPALEPIAGRSLPSILVALGEALGAPEQDEALEEIRAELAPELGLSPAGFERLRRRGGRITWSSLRPGGTLTLEPEARSWPVPSGPRSRLEGLLASRREAGDLRREAS